MTYVNQPIPHCPACGRYISACICSRPIFGKVELPLTDSKLDLLERRVAELERIIRERGQAMADERKAFEHWMLALFPSADLTRAESGEYIVERTELRWLAWSERAKHDAKVMRPGIVRG